MFLIKAAIRRYAMSIGMAAIPFSFVRVLLLRACGVTIGRGCYIGFNVVCDTNFPELVVIGDNVTISHNCMIITHTASPARSFLAKVYLASEQVNIGNGAWIGANSTILPGISVGKDCMIGAGSVVTRSTDERSLWAGNPCQRIKSIAAKDSQEIGE